MILCDRVIFFGSLYCLFVLIIRAEQDITSFVTKVKSSKLKIDDILKGIQSKWKFDEYSNFLNSAAMTRTAWEVLKVRLISL